MILRALSLALSLAFLPAAHAEIRRPAEPLECTHNRSQCIGQDFDRDREPGAKPVDELAFVDHDDELIGQRVDDLLARVGCATPLDQSEVGSDLISANGHKHAARLHGRGCLELLRKIAAYEADTGTIPDCTNS